MFLRYPWVLRFLYTEDEPNSPRQNNPSNFTEIKKEGVYKIVNFKGFSRPNKDIKYFLRT